jgi:outer membrane protein TolC
MFICWACLLLLLSGCGHEAKTSGLDVQSRYDNLGDLSAEEAPSESSGHEIVKLDHPLSFSECVTFALQNAPQIISGKTQLKISQLNADNAYYSMFPEINVILSVSQMLNKSNSSSDSTSLRLSFNSSPYDPFGAYYSNEAQKILNKIAVVKHLMAVDALMRNIGESYLEMEAKVSNIALLEKDVEIFTKMVAYYSALPENQADKPLELLEAKAQRRNVALRLNREQVSLKQMQVQLKLLIGADVDQKVEFAVQGASEQLIGSFSPDAVSMDKARTADWDLQVSDLAQEVSKYRVLVAWAQYIPLFSIGLTTPDPVSSDKEEKYYGILRMQTPLIDWGRRSRGVDRAKLNQIKDAVDRKSAQRAFEVDYIQARQNIDIYTASDEYEVSKADLDALRNQKNALLYEAGIIALPRLLESRSRALDNQIQLNETHLQKDKAVFEFRVMAGDLFSTMIGDVKYDVQ